MSVKVPDALKAELPQTTWGKMLSATPVVMAVLATLLAGLASSEMTRAQYDRSLAAQQQSKAGDQWSFFQAKRMRAVTQRNTLDVLQAVADIGPENLAAMKDMAVYAGNKELQALLASPAGEAAVAAMVTQKLPDAGAGLELDKNLKAALEAIETFRPDREITAAANQVSDRILDDAIRAAQDRTIAMDKANKPVDQAIDSIEQAMKTVRGPAMVMPRNVTAARLGYSAVRYDAEARLNQTIANLYELQVRKSNLSAERHHLRSERFFYGMLAAQLGVIVATLAMAMRRRNLLWTVAAGAGVAAVVFGAYVYLYV